MKKLLIISLLIISASARSQTDWSNYSTSFERTDNKPSLGVAVPYNGIYDNFTKNVVGISDWNPRYKLNIDTALDDQIPLFFVYDTVGVHFLVPGVNEKNASDFEFTVLLNNKSTITPWSPVTQFTEFGATTGNYSADIGGYLVAHLRNKQGAIISSMVVYFKKNSPEIKSLSTSDNALVFSRLVNNKDHFSEQQLDIGWHRQYTSKLAGKTDKLKLSYNENNVLIQVNSKIYRKEAVEYVLLKNDREIRAWGANEYDNNNILLKNLDPGEYTIRIRFKRQRESVTELHFSISSVWYKTAAFKVAIFALVVMAVVVFTFYRRQKQALVQINKRAEQTAGELKNIHALLNPHFTFNALNSIQGLVNKGDVDAASKYLSSFGELLRETLKESKTEHISLTKELENLEIYIGLEQIRYPFQYALTVDPTVDLYSATIPPFILQPFVENSIKHGFSKMNGLGKLIVSIEKQGDTMIVKIIDNGPGFDSSSINEGYGMSLSRRRIELLNTNYGEELISLQVENTNEGTLIELFFKNWL